MGQSPDGDSYNTTGAGVPLINGPVEFSDESFGETIRSKFTTQPTKLCKKGDLILCVRGSTTGRMNIAGFDACVGRGVAAIRAHEYQPWVNYFVSSRRDEIHGKGTGATFPNVSGSTLANFELVMPPLDEQKRIIGSLDEAFAGLATAAANAEKNLQNARAIFNSQLQSIFTQRGDGWKEKTLEEVATTFGRGKSKHRPRNAPHLYGGKYPFIQTGDIRNAEHYITEYTQTYSEAGLAQSKLWPKGTICITIAANIAETAILSFDACFPDSVIGVVPNPREAEVGYVEYVLQAFKARLQALGKGSAQANINMGTFEHERFPFPSVSEQKLIVAKLDALSEETQHLEDIYEQKLAALEALKKSLLHQAFAGNL
ncbi:restriction endonuclease subunit S [Bradyrhizobium icense]|nr:restriction endonuclease subunit S [Bradyrhizobium icense]